MLFSPYAVFVVRKLATLLPSSGFSTTTSHLCQHIGAEVVMTGIHTTLYVEVVLYPIAMAMGWYQWGIFAIYV